MDTVEAADDFFNAIVEDTPTKRNRVVHVPPHYTPKPKPKPRTDEEWKTIFEFYPTTPDGYMKSYLPNQFEEYKAALKKYGFFVVKVVESEQCDATVPELFFDLNRRAQRDGRQQTPILPDDPSTWENINFPSQKKFLSYCPAFTQKSFENRTNPQIYEVFCHLFDRTDLWCNIDNWGLFRATTNLKFPDGIRERPDWRYNLKLHWDYNPWILRKWEEDGEPPLFQGVLALADCPEEVGGFSCVPCSAEFLTTWTSERPCPRMDKASMRVPEKDPMQNYIQHVPLRKGEMVIWNSKTAHANFPNNSSKMRIHQYIRMLPADKQSNDKDRYAPVRIMHKWRTDPFTTFSVEGLPYLSDLGRKLVGLEPWPLKDRPSFWKKSMVMHDYVAGGGKETHTEEESNSGKDEEDY